MKEHKTLDEQVEILRMRGMTITNSDKFKEFLRQENYYNVINGYKDLFLQYGDDGRKLTPEKYKRGTRAEELQMLYLFDRELRSILLKNLLAFEKSVKTQIAYEFSARHIKMNSYLELNNFRNEPEKVLKLISVLTQIISNKVKKEPSIKHYIDNHGGVPLWVLVNYLTIGNVSYFFEMTTDDFKNTIAKFYSEKFSIFYNTHLTISSADLTAIIKMTNILRNKCAHEERTYNTRFENIRSANIANHFGLSHTSNEKLMVAFILLKATLDKVVFTQLIEEMSSLFENYKNEFHTISFADILDKMGINETDFDRLK